jgi:glycosyltransferase involved in cell wall biosynthesis
LSDGAVAVIGVPLYNSGLYLERAIASLLAQTDPRLALVLVDDASTDGTDVRAQRIAARDPRVSYVRNERRLGLVGNWRRCYQESVARHPEAPYFAWGSDHDVWEPRWLERLVAALEAHPQCVLAYPLSVRVDTAGEHLSAHRRFTSHDMAEPVFRFRASFGRMAPGNAIYGLFRAPAVARAGVFRDVLLPDRLLLAELSIDGRFVEVPEVLWIRRQTVPATIARQRATLYADKRPWYDALPWWAQHVIAFASAYAGRGEGRPRHGRLDGMVWTFRYVYTVAIFQHKRRRLPFALARKHLRKRVHRLLGPAALVRASTLERMRLMRRVTSDPEPEPVQPPAAALSPERQDGVFFSREPTVVERQLSDVELELGSIKKAVQHGLAQIAKMEESIADSRNAITRQEGVRVRFDEPRFTELARPVVDSGRTMLSLPRLFTLYNAVANSVRPDTAVAEVGTFRGGTAYFLASAIRERLGQEAPLYVFDTFEGHPENKVSEDVEPEQAVGSFSETSAQDVREYLSDFERVQVIEGEAVASLRGLEEQTFSLVHLDVDLYLPTLEFLRYFMPRLAPGGAIVVDDYGAPSCPGIARAIDEFLAERDDVQRWPMLTEQAVLLRR